MCIHISVNNYLLREISSPDCHFFKRGWGYLCALQIALTKCRLKSKSASHPSGTVSSRRWAPQASSQSGTPFTRTSASSHMYCRNQWTSLMPSHNENVFSDELHRDDSRLHTCWVFLLIECRHYDLGDPVVTAFRFTFFIIAKCGCTERPRHSLCISSPLYCSLVRSCLYHC